MEVEENLVIIVEEVCMEEKNLTKMATIVGDEGKPNIERRLK